MTTTSFCPMLANAVCCSTLNRPEEKLELGSCAVAQSSAPWVNPAAVVQPVLLTGHEGTLKQDSEPTAFVQQSSIENLKLLCV